MDYLYSSGEEGAGIAKRLLDVLHLLRFYRSSMQRKRPPPRLDHKSPFKALSRCQINAKRTNGRDKRTFELTQIRFDGGGDVASGSALTSPTV